MGGLIERARILGNYAISFSFYLLKLRFEEFFSMLYVYREYERLNFRGSPKISFAIGVISLLCHMLFYCYLVNYCNVI